MSSGTLKLSSNQPKVLKKAHINSNLNSFQRIQIKEVAIQNVCSKLFITANILPNTQSENNAIIKVTQESYEPNHSGQGFKHNFWNLPLKV